MNQEMKIRLTAEIGKLKQNLADAKKEVQTFGEKVKAAKADAEANLKNLGDSIGNGLKSGIKTAATALAGMATAILALGPATAEYRAEQAKLTSAFEAAGSSAEVAKSTYNDLYRVLGDGGQATEAASHLAKLTTEEKALSEWTNICQGVYATFGASLPIESLTEAANETAKTGALTGGLADALNWAGIAEEEFQAKLDACNTEAEREALIRETLNGTYAVAAEEYEKNAEALLRQNEENAKLQENLALLGEAVAPIITAFTSFANDALALVIPHIQSLAETYGPKLEEVLGTMGEKVSTIVKAIADNWEIIAAIAGVIGGIAAAIGLYNVVAAVKAAMDAAQVTTLGALAAAYLAQAAAMAVAIAPYALIVAAIAAVIAIIVVCVKHWDEIKAAVAKAWDWIKEKTKAAVDAVVNFFNNLKEKISTTVENIKNAVKEKFEAVKTTVSTILQAAKEVVVNIFEAIKNSIKEKIELAQTIIKNVIGIIKGIFTGDFGAVKQSVANIFDAIKNSIKSKIEGARDFVKGAIDKIKGFFNFKWELPKLKLPHFSMTGKFSLNPPSIPKISVEWYQKGGVFDNPTLFGYGNGMLGGLGENGAEAVVPLEKNTEWLDRIAERLATKNQAPIYLMVDKKVLGQAAADGMNGITRATGKIPLEVLV